MTAEGPEGESVLAEELDLRGLKCPMPVLVTRRRLRSMAAGARLAVTVTDAMAPLDLRHLCQTDGHTLVEEVPETEGARRLLISRGPLMLGDHDAD